MNIFLQISILARLPFILLLSSFFCISPVIGAVTELKEGGITVRVTLTDTKRQTDFKRCVYIRVYLSTILVSKEKQEICNGECNIYNLQKDVSLTFKVYEDFDGEQPIAESKPRKFTKNGVIEIPINGGEAIPIKVPPIAKPQSQGRGNPKKTKCDTIIKYIEVIKYIEPKNLEQEEMIQILIADTVKSHSKIRNDSIYILDLISENNSIKTENQILNKKNKELYTQISQSRQKKEKVALDSISVNKPHIEEEEEENESVKLKFGIKSKIDIDFKYRIYSISLILNQISKSKGDIIYSKIIGKIDSIAVSDEMTNLSIKWRYEDYEYFIKDNPKMSKQYILLVEDKNSKDIPPRRIDISKEIVTIPQKKRN